MNDVVIIQNALETLSKQDNIGNGNTLRRGGGEGGMREGAERERGRERT